MWGSKRDTDVQYSLLDAVGEGEGGIIWENGIETCILSYVKWIASPGLMQRMVFFKNADSVAIKGLSMNIWQTIEGSKLI